MQRWHYRNIYCGRRLWHGMGRISDTEFPLAGQVLFDNFEKHFDISAFSEVFILSSPANSISVYSIAKSFFSFTGQKQHISN